MVVPGDHVKPRSESTAVERGAADGVTSVEAFSFVALDPLAFALLHTLQRKMPFKPATPARMFSVNVHAALATVAVNGAGVKKLSPAVVPAAPVPAIGPVPPINVVAAVVA